MMKNKANKRRKREKGGVEVRKGEKEKEVKKDRGSRE